MKSRVPFVLAAMLVIVLLTLTGLPAISQPPPGEANYMEKIPGTSVSMEMIAIPAGSFTMGSPESEPGRKSDEGPQHQVKLDAFWMSKFEVLWDAYDLYWKEE